MVLQEEDLIYKSVPLSVSRQEVRVNHFLKPLPYVVFLHLQKSYWLCASIFSVMPSIAAIIFYFK